MAKTSLARTQEIYHGIYNNVKPLKGHYPKRGVVVNFHWREKESQYSNFGEKIGPISILPGSFDPLSVFYAFRLQDLKEDLVIERAVTDGKKCVIGRAKVIKREKIKVINGIYDTYLVEPDLEHIGGVLPCFCLE